MFSHIIRNVNGDVEVESSSRISDKLVRLVQFGEQSYLEHEEAKTSLNEIKMEIAQKEEQLYNIDRERVKLMSDLALQMQSRHDLKNKVDNLKNTLESTKFELKKYNKMKISTVDLENLNHMKKTFVTYKDMMKIYFDYSNGPDAIKQKGYMCNTITKRLSYFEYHTGEITADELTRRLWNKLKKISDDQWEYLAA